MIGHAWDPFGGHLGLIGRPKGAPKARGSSSHGSPPPQSHDFGKLGSHLGLFLGDFGIHLAAQCLFRVHSFHHEKACLGLCLSRLLFYKKRTFLQRVPPPSIQSPYQLQLSLWILYRVLHSRETIAVVQMRCGATEHTCGATEHTCDCHLVPRAHGCALGDVALTVPMDVHWSCLSLACQ